MAGKKIEKSKELLHAEDGCLDAAYAVKDRKGWFVKIKPSLSIDKMCFSFVHQTPDPKNSNAVICDDHFDIYISIRLMRAWCQRIVSGRFFADLEAEKARGVSYPESYKLKTGDNGSRELGFMLSRTPGNVVINAKDASHSYVNIPVSFFFMENIAYDFLEITKERFSELLRLTLKSSTSYWDKYGVAGAEDSEVYEEEGALFEEEYSSGEQPESNASVPVISGPKSGASAAVQVSGDIITMETFWATAKGSVKEKRGKDGSATVLRLVVPTLDESEPGILSSNANYQLADCLFYENSLKKAGKVEEFNSILERIEKGSTQVKIAELRYKKGDVRNGYRQLIFSA